MRALFLSLSILIVTLPISGAAAVPPDVLVIGQTAEPQSLDPHAVTSLNDFRILAGVYEGLVEFGADSLEIQPSLATRWTISEDGRIYTFHLRKGVTFHDGTPFDARAVKYSFARMLDPDHPAHDTGPFPLAFLFEAIKDIAVVGPHTIRFRLDAPYAPLLSNLAYPAGFIVSPEAVKAHGRAFGRHPAGTGPFRFDEWQSGIKVQLRRYTDYWGGTPMLEAVIFRPIVNANTRVAELLAGGLDVMTGVPFDMLPILRERADFTVHEEIGPHLWFLILNMRDSPFSDRRMRLAVNYAIDKEALVTRILQGAAEVASGPIPKAFGWAHNTDIQPYPHDPEKARALIRQAGHAGARLVLAAPEGGSGMLEPTAMATAIQADLAEVGLKVEIRTFEWNTYLGKVNAGLEGFADMAEMAWMTNDPDTLPFLALRRDAWPEEGGFNSGYYANPVVDKLLRQARRVTGREARAPYYRRVHKIVHEEVPWVFVASWKQSVVTSRRVKGFDLRPSFLFEFDHVRTAP